MRIEILYFWTIYQLLNDFYNYNLGKEFQQKQVLNLEEFDKDLSEYDLISKDEETNKDTFPKIDFIYEEAQNLLDPEHVLEDKGGKKADKKGKKGKEKKQPRKP